MIDKSKWGDGPWQTEPDRVEFTHAGFDCLMLRTYNMGSWCGYVAIPPWHPWFEKPYDEIPVDVHGGPTYGGHCSDRICHTPKPGQSDNVWWIGFDFAHGGDFMPGHRAQLAEMYAQLGTTPERDFHADDVYKDERYVRAECESVARQVFAASAGT